MHAHVKSTQGEDVALGYCPLDLYSGDEARITKAIHALWDAWIGSSGSVNNMRVFCNGLMLKPSSLVSPFRSAVAVNSAANVALKSGPSCCPDYEPETRRAQPYRPSR